MPRKIRQLIKDLKQSGFIIRGGKGSHRNFVYKSITITISGKDGSDAKQYQERDVKKAIERSKYEKN